MATVYQEYAAAANQTVTALEGLASSSTWQSGWSSGTIDNTSNKYLDYVVSAKFTVESAGLSAGEIRVYVYTMLDDSNWPDLFSSGTEGTAGAATVHDAEQLASGFVLLWSTATDTGASDVYSMPQTSIRSALGFMPPKCALYIAQSTGTTLETTGQQVTVKGLYETIA